MHTSISYAFHDKRIVIRITADQSYSPVFEMVYSVIHRMRISLRIKQRSTLLLFTSLLSQVDRASSSV
jgi:hypothetical protein